MYEFGGNLRKYRKKCNLTQKQLAKKLDIRDTNISKYETDAAFPQYEILIKLPQILNTTLDELCGLQSKKSMPLSSLSDNQIKVIQSLADLFRAQNSNAIKKQLSTEQYAVLGEIVVELLK